MAYEIKEIKPGLHDTPEDKRDFEFGAFYTLPDLSKLPVKFIVGTPLKIKDQGDSDLCTAYAVTAVSEDQERIELSPEYQFAKTKQITGNPDQWGADLRSACKSLKEFGSFPVYKIKELPEDPRDWKSWPMEYEEEAVFYKKQSYFKITGPYDLFDNMRATMWLNRKEKRSIFTGVRWRNEWTHAPSGFIPQSYSDGGVPHAIKICGWTENDCLVAQLSNGTNIGDDGMFYIPREVVNKEFTFSAFTFKDIAPEKAKEFQENDLKISRINKVLILLRKLKLTYKKLCWVVF